MNLEKDIATKIRNRQYELSRHAVDQSITREITTKEIEQALLSNQLQVIEDYPNDKYSPSCLVLGYTKRKRPLHIQCSYPTRPILKIITLYEPDPMRWADNRIRRNNPIGNINV